jgi:hypothetical protein
MIEGLILTCILGVTHAQGWSYPVVSIETPDFNIQRKDLIVTDGNHVHQIWDSYNEETRIGYNIVLPDGSVLLPDTMISRDSWSAYPSMSDASDTAVIGFWRENSPIWYSTRDHDGVIVLPPTTYTSESWLMWPTVDSDIDSLNRVHMVWNISDGSVCYSVMEPGVGELFRDTIPNSMQACLIDVDGPRVHIKFNGYPDQLADYIQYDLEGNVTIPAVSLVEYSGTNSNFCSMSHDSNGDAYIFVFESRQSEPSRLSLYKVNGSTGEVMIDGLMLYQAPQGNVSLLCPNILTSSENESFYLMWIEDDLIQVDDRLIKFAVIDTNGNFIEEPYIAYDYTDEDPQQLAKLSATTNDDGDVFAHWSAYFPSVSGFYVVLGWFDHNWLGIEEETASVVPPDISLILSSNPFHDFLTIEVTGVSWLSELSVYDITGRIVRSLGLGEGNTFQWDGRDDEGNDLPVGTYVIRAESQSITTAAKIVKL